jgi:hypothetical protein
MKKAIFPILLLLLVAGLKVIAQKTSSGEKFGRTLNLGIGIGGYTGYYHYVGHSLPVIALNYEFDVSGNFTLAPFISFSAYRNRYYWHNGYYYYHETIIPMGVRGSYYFDHLFRASSKWDFYAGGSLGFVLVNEYWDNGYEGDRNYYRSGSPLFLDLNIGTEYHFNKRVGAFLELSTGVSTIGLSFHR